MYSRSSPSSIINPDDNSSNNSDTRISIHPSQFTTPSPPRQNVTEDYGLMSDDNNNTIIQTTAPSSSSLHYEQQQEQQQSSSQQQQQQQQFEDISISPVKHLYHTQNPPKREPPPQPQPPILSSLSYFSKDNEDKNRQQQQGGGGEHFEVVDARPILPLAAFFMGDLRDGLPMINMQSSFLMSSKNFTEKEIGLLFFVFGISQVLFMAPAGYFLDYSNNKINWVIGASAVISLLTILTAVLAQPHDAAADDDGSGNDNDNLLLMIIIHFLQGGVTSLLPSGFNAITLGIVGSTGFTHQVSRNKMMNHVGTALIVSIASLVAYFTYPNIGLLFVVSPLACCGVAYFLRKIKPEHVDTDAARGLVVQSPTMTEYETLDEEKEVKDIMSSVAVGGDNDDCKSDVTSSESGASSSSSSSSISVGEGNNKTYVPPNVDDKKNNNNVINLPMGIQVTGSSAASVKSMSSNVSKHLRKGPSYIFGFFGSTSPEDDTNAALDGRQQHRPRASTPLAVLLNRNFIVFTMVVFFFHMSNSSVLPLVMQSVAVDDPRTGILLSGLCILVAQSFMMFFAKICGDYSPIWGRKDLFLVGLFSLPLRCYLLVIFLNVKDKVETSMGDDIMKGLILSTQLLDAVGAGIFGTLYIIVTNDISGGTGRFSLMLGITTGAMCLGGTVSGYIGQSLAQDYGYSTAIGILGILSLIPAFMYLLCMPETLPDYDKDYNEKKIKRRKKLISMLMKRLRRRKKKNKKKEKLEDDTKMEKTTTPNYDQGEGGGGLTTAGSGLQGMNGRDVMGGSAAGGGVTTVGNHYTELL